MKINKDSLKARANNISKKMNISQNIVYNRFFFDSFLLRLAASPYKEKFILKGGLYLSSVLGIESRSTMDIDFCVKQLAMEKQNIVDIITEVAKIDIGDAVNFEVIGTSEIRIDDPYGGYQIKVLCKLENVRCEFGIDIATGDPIIPSERNYEYKCLVTGDVLPIKAYSLESVISEKLQTLLLRQFTNSRCTDFYDLYILRKLQLNNVDKQLFNKAFSETCKHRNFSISKPDALALIDEIANNTGIKSRWIAYAKNNKYASGIDFQEVVNSIKEWLE